MAVINIAQTISQTGWGNRKKELMITSTILKSDVLRDFTIIEGVKSKAQIPTQEASIKWGTDFCDVKAGGDGTMDLGEKEVSVSPHTWYFSNCQTTLFETFRSQMMRKGVNTEQTLDDELKEWLFDFFAKKNAEKTLIDAATEIKAKIKTDNTVVKVAVTADEDVLVTLQKMYKAMPKELLDMIAGEADQEYKPVIYMNSVKLREYTLAVAEKNSVIKYGMDKAEKPTFLGMEIKLFSSLGNNDIIITNPKNLLIITDDLGDVRAINAKYDELNSTDEFYGKYLMGYDFRLGKHIVSHIEGDAPAEAPAVAEGRKR